MSKIFSESDFDEEGGIIRFKKPSSTNILQESYQTDQPSGVRAQAFELLPIQCDLGQDTWAQSASNKLFDGSLFSCSVLCKP